LEERRHLIRFLKTRDLMNFFRNLIVNVLLPPQLNFPKGRHPPFTMDKFCKFFMYRVKTYICARATPNLRVIASRAVA
jgi:hypothetical protein